MRASKKCPRINWEVQKTSTPKSKNSRISNTTEKNQLMKKLMLRKSSKIKVPKESIGRKSLLKKIAIGALWNSKTKMKMKVSRRWKKYLTLK